MTWSAMATNERPLGHQHAAAFDIGHLPVGELHEVYYEQYGKKDGKPGEAHSGLNSNST